MGYMFKGARALVTGASSGIGLAIASQLASAGCDVAIAARRRSRLDALAENLSGLGIRVFPITADLSRPEEGDALIEKVRSRMGGLDILINNAGAGNTGEFAQLAFSKGETLLHLNLHTPLKLMRAFLPEMIERKRGWVVNISSVAAMLPLPKSSYYNASKIALALATETIRLENLVHRSKVRFLVVYPGPIHSEMLERTKKDPQAARLFALLPHGTTEELARRTLKAIEKGEGTLIYPRFYNMARLLSGPLQFSLSSLSQLMVK